MEEGENVAFFSRLFASLFLCSGLNKRRRVTGGQMAACYDTEEEQTSSGLFFIGKQVFLDMQSMEWIYVCECGGEGVEKRSERSINKVLQQHVSVVDSVMQLLQHHLLSG